MTLTEVVFALELPPIRACVPVRPRSWVAQSAAMVALAESEQNHPPEAALRALLGVPRIDSPGLVSEAIHLVGKTWQPGRLIDFGFLDGSPAQRRKAQRWAEEWLAYANLEFRFDVAPHPDVRVSFRPGGSWSLIGTDCLAVPAGPTMQLGWVTDTSDDTSDRAVIVHEVGHALGLGHEQSSPSEDIHWDRPKAMAYYERTQGWDEATVEANVFAVFDRGQVEGTAYDRTSIMQYPVPAELTTDGRGIPWNTDLSPLDESHIAAVYPGHPPGSTPFPVPPPAPPGPAPGATPLATDGSPVRARAAAGAPARFDLALAARRTVVLTFAVDATYGRPPTVVCRPAGDKSWQAMTLMLTRGQAVLMLGPGDYEFDVYHPFPRVAVAATARAIAVG